MVYGLFGTERFIGVIGFLAIGTIFVTVTAYFGDHDHLAYEIGTCLVILAAVLACVDLLGASAEEWSWVVIFGIAYATTTTGFLWYSGGQFLGLSTFWYVVLVPDSIYSGFEYDFRAWQARVELKPQNPPTSSQGVHHSVKTQNAPIVQSASTTSAQQAPAESNVVQHITSNTYNIHSSKDVTISGRDSIHADKSNVQTGDGDQANEDNQH